MAKRKEIEEAMEGFSYPHFKIRRLEPKLPHPIEEVPFQVGGLGGEPACEMTHTMDEIVPPLSEMTYTVDETFPPPSSTDDRAIVLYTPADTFLNLGPVPSNPSLLVSPELLRNLKNQAVHQGSCQNMEDNSPAGNDCLALVPWVPSVAAEMASYWSSSQHDQNPVMIEELMESEESTSMEIETEPVESHHTSIFGEKGGREGFHHQRQLHCMAPGTQPNPTSHVMWSQ
ncbi:hypothetical protein FCM35_KLT08676 [Carex littledalei]|uniref:Uncharacterized protein n=1 Tax=Carex littledalei TaxID=544730 RepID=A0A833QV56_9POAL|nr:hypothetical protein FCM35_KLT08676 [Carex littledalei]